MKRLAIITARAGSKGLKDKNIIDVCGKPLIAYSIEAAVDSGIFDRIIVSTDSERYAEISRGYGAEVMMRGKELSDDKASSFVVIRDVLMRAGEEYDYFMLLQPTSPMRRAHHVREAAERFETEWDRFDLMVSVTQADHNGLLVRPIEEDLSLKHFDTDFSNYKRQAYCDYSPNGAIFAAKPAVYLEQKHFFGAKSQAYIMDKRSSVDIDDEMDYKFACLLVSEEEKQNGKN